MILLLVASVQPAWADAGQKWAVVIGIDRYDSSTVTELECAEADARLLAETLVETAGFPRQNVFQLTSSHSGDQAPTRTNIAFRFDYLSRNVAPEDTLVVFFSGHGVEVDGQCYLLTREADARTSLTLEQSALHAAELFRWLQATRAGNVLLVVDACRNDPSPSRGLEDNPLSQNMARDLTLVRREAARAEVPAPVSTATLFACSSGERSYEWSDKGHGFFTYHLVEGLKGAAAESDGRVTLASLARHVQKTVPESSSRWALKRQVPWLRYEGPGGDQWVLARHQPGRTESEAERRAREAEEAREQAERRAQEAEQARREAELRASQDSQRAAPGGDLMGRLLDLEERLAGAAGAQQPTRVLWVSKGAGAPYSTISGALAGAPAGARILIRPGIYEEDVVVDKAVDLVGDGPVAEIVIRGSGTYVVDVRSPSPVHIEGLTLQTAGPETRHVGGAAELKNCRLLEVSR
ncbi:MAG: caspase family protein [Armatimonadetes bacterium]|nr:caspase family protein [Armatimonadota bacterium]